MSHTCRLGEPAPLSLKIAQVCPYDWSVPGGVRTHVIGLSSALERTGATVQIVAPASGPEPGIFVAGRPFPVPANGSVARICFSRSASRRLSRMIEREGFDLLHLHEPAIPSISLLSLWASGSTPIVGTFHASASRSFGYLVAGPILDRSLRRLGSRITVSTSARALISRYFDASYHLIPNGIDTTPFGDVRPDAAAAEMKPFVLFFGRPEPRKGFPVLLEAMEHVRRAIPKVVLALNGEPPSGVPEWVRGLGKVTDARKPSVFAAADVFCSPSTEGESFGYVLVEAMAAGVPVVASALQGHIEAAGGAALLARPSDAKNLAGKIIEVLQNPEVSRDLAAKGRQRAGELDWKTLVPEIIRAYSEAAPRRMMNLPKKED